MYKSLCGKRTLLSHLVHLILPQRFLNYRTCLCRCRGSAFSLPQSFFFFNGLSLISSCKEKSSTKKVKIQNFRQTQCYTKQCNAAQNASELDKQVLGDCFALKQNASSTVPLLKLFRIIENKTLVFTSTVLHEQALRTKIIWKTNIHPSS